MTTTYFDLISLAIAAFGPLNTNIVAMMRARMPSVNRGKNGTYNVLVLSVTTPSGCDIQLTAGCHAVAMWIPHSNTFKIRTPYDSYFARIMEYWFKVIQWAKKLFEYLLIFKGF